MKTKDMIIELDKPISYITIALTLGMFKALNTKYVRVVYGDVKKEEFITFALDSLINNIEQSYTKNSCKYIKFFVTIHQTDRSIKFLNMKGVR